MTAATAVRAIMATVRRTSPSASGRGDSGWGAMGTSLGGRGQRGRCTPTQDPGPPVLPTALQSLANDVGAPLSPGRPATRTVSRGHPVGQFQPSDRPVDLDPEARKVTRPSRWPPARG